LIDDLVPPMLWLIELRVLEELDPPPPLLVIMLSSNQSMIPTITATRPKLANK